TPCCTSSAESESGMGIGNVCLYLKRWSRSYSSSSRLSEAGIVCECCSGQSEVDGNQGPTNWFRLKLPCQWCSLRLPYVLSWMIHSRIYEEQCSSLMPSASQTAKKRTTSRSTSFTSSRSNTTCRLPSICFFSCSTCSD